MYCTVCGNQLNESDKFCPQCGASTAKDAPPRGAFRAPTERRLVRPMYEKNIAGVCAGFANYLDVDVTLLRVIWLCAAIFTGGVLFVAYLICWVVMPKDYGPTGAGERTVPTQPAPEPPDGRADTSSSPA